MYRLVQSCVGVQAGAELCWCTGWCKVVLVYRLVQSCIGVQAGAKLCWCTGWCKVSDVSENLLCLSFFIQRERQVP